MHEILWVLQLTIWINLSSEVNILSFMPLAYFLPNPSSLPCAKNPLTESENF